MLRNLGALLLGMLLGSVANMALIYGNLALFPLPDGVSMQDQEGFRAYIQGLPPLAFVLPFLAHFSQVLVGGLVATKVGTAEPRLLVGIIGALTVLGSVLNNLNLGVPAWVWVELVLYVPVILGTIRLAERMRS